MDGSDDESSAADEDMLDEHQDSDAEELDEAECSESEGISKQAEWGPKRDLIDTFLWYSEDVTMQKVVTMQVAWCNPP